MKNKIMDRYYKGCALDAYELFGAHLCEERGKRSSLHGVCTACARHSGHRLL